MTNVIILKWRNPRGRSPSEEQPDDCPSSSAAKRPVPASIQALHLHPSNAQESLVQSMKLPHG